MQCLIDYVLQRPIEKNHIWLTVKGRLVGLEIQIDRLDHQVPLGLVLGKRRLEQYAQVAGDNSMRTSGGRRHKQVSIQNFVAVVFVAGKLVQIRQAVAREQSQ